jgi:chromosome segregation and condensation protein ScpB
LQGLSSNERLIILTLINSELKLSYEDIARLLGKERSTIRGQINAIKRKSEGLIQEIAESNGKKRVYVSEEIKEKLEKYAKVRVRKEKKVRK